MKILKDNGLKVTPQRLDIMMYLDKHRTHPTADDIYQELKKGTPSLSKTTVYNSLDTLSKHKIIQVLTISGTEMRYDFRSEMHHHFLCDDCGKIIDINVSCPFQDKMLNCEHEVKEVHGYFKGTCKDCLKKKGNTSAN